MCERERERECVCVCDLFWVCVLCGMCVVWWYGGLAVVSSMGMGMGMGMGLGIGMGMGMWSLERSVFWECAVVLWCCGVVCVLRTYYLLRISMVCVC